ncbi:MAG: ABC transporter ATP-binding protein/permease [Bellilinea sp.]|nr:ABC transporter ATP-binding protein/permease [Bellilinea sp.]
MKRHLRNLKTLVKPYFHQVLLASVFLLILTIIEMAFPAIVRQVIDVGLKGGNHRFLIIAAGLILGLGLIKALVSFREQYLTEWIAHHVAYDLRNRLYDHIQRLSFHYHDHMPTGQLISRVIEDVRSLQSFAGHGLVELARIIILLIGIGILLFSRHPVLAAIAISPLIPLVLLTTDFGKRVGRLFLAVDNTLGELSSILQENVVGVQVVRAFAQEKYETERFDQTNRKLFDRQITVVREWAKVMPSTIFLVTLGTILILWFGGQMAIRGEITVGELVAFNSYMLLLANPAQQLAWLVNAAGEAYAGLQRTFEILETEPDIQSPPNALLCPTFRGEILFERVSFRYYHNERPILSDINLKIEPNQRIAIIGATGSGKTTLVNLIPRFYDVSEGAVKIDGIDVRQMHLPSLRRQIGIVLQTSLLFSTTIRENLAYGRPDASDEEIIAAAKAAQAHEFIMELPQGYDTVVGERGVTLSGGQRQRIAIGRALLMNPRILILDDSTSSVDTQTEHLIQRALSTLMEGRTTLIIAQRLSTVKKADLILVMDQGRIVEQGTHQQLLALNGLYRQIYDLQLKNQEELEEDLSIQQVDYGRIKFRSKNSLE